MSPKTGSRQIDNRLGLLLQTAHREAQIGSAGVKIPPLAMESVGADTRFQEIRSGVALVLVGIMFMLIMGTPMMVAMGVVEEKGSRIVEILLTSVRPWQLLGGKILGIGAVGMINLSAVLAAGLTGALVSGLAVGFPPGMTGIVAGVLVWFILGYLHRALKAGVRGFIPKDASAEELAAAIRKVYVGGRYLDPDMAVEAMTAGENALTDRECAVLALAAEGASVAQIAQALHLTEGTVRNYVSNAITKLGAGNRITAIRVARDMGWI